MIYDQLGLQTYVAAICFFVCLFGIRKHVVGALFSPSQPKLLTWGCQHMRGLTGTK
jgi:hypothetical protein